jgi:E3 ubiquitin-protein ligase HERC2
MDKCLPNHRLFADPLALQMLEFVGKLMGMSLRAKLTLPFSFPSLVWKLLLGEEATIEDLRDVDSMAASQIDQLSAYLDLRDDGGDLEMLFNQKYTSVTPLYFTFTGSDGHEEELVPHGSTLRVTFHNLRSYCNALLLKQLHQFDEGIRAMVKGLHVVVPMHALFLFSWHEVEVLVAGQAIFNIPLWKANTESTLTLSPLVVELFWKVIESLTSKEQEGFVRFAWGRSRLPNTAAEFVVKMKLGPAGSRGAKLPIAHVSYNHASMHANSLSLNV